MITINRTTLIEVLQIALGNYSRKSKSESTMQLVKNTAMIQLTSSKSALTIYDTFEGDKFSCDIITQTKQVNVQIEIPNLYRVFDYLKLSSDDSIKIEREEKEVERGNGNFVNVPILVITTNKGRTSVEVSNEVIELPAARAYVPAFTLTEEMIAALQTAKKYCSTDDYKPHLCFPLVSNGYIYASSSYEICKIPTLIEGDYIIPLQMIDPMYCGCKVTFTDKKVILTKSDFFRSINSIQDVDCLKTVGLFESVLVTQKNEVLEVEKSRLKLSCEIAKALGGDGKTVIVRTGEKAEGEDVKELLSEDVDSGSYGTTFLGEDTNFGSNFVFGISLIRLQLLVSTASDEIVKIYHSGKPTEMVCIKQHGALFGFMPIRIAEEYTIIDNEVNESNVFERTNWRSIYDWKSHNMQHFEAWHIEQASEKFLESLKQRRVELNKGMYSLQAVADYNNLLNEIEGLVVQQSTLTPKLAALSSKEPKFKTLTNELKQLQKSELQKRELLNKQHSYPTLEFCTAENERITTECNKLTVLQAEFKQNPLAFITIPSPAEYYDEMPLVEAKKGKAKV